MTRLSHDTNPVSDPAAVKELQGDLQPGETLIWAGRPAQNGYWRGTRGKRDMLNLLGMVGALLFMSLIGWLAGEPLFWRWMLPLFWCLLPFGLVFNYFLDRSERKKTFFGLTNRRLLHRSFWVFPIWGMITNGHDLSDIVPLKAADDPQFGTLKIYGRTRHLGIMPSDRLFRRKYAREVELFDLENSERVRSLINAEIAKHEPTKWN